MKKSSFSIITVIISLLANAVYSQPVCPRPVSLEWHTQQQTVQLKWTLRDNLCMNEAQCWTVQDEVETLQARGQAHNSPQICPIELQRGDKLLFSTDHTLESYGIQLVNVSRENFESCSTANETQDQLLFAGNITGSKQVEPKWVLPGKRYFIALHDGSSELCRLGLRLSVSVKQQLCQHSPLGTLCSGRGVCQTSLGEAAYHCQCRRNHSGKFCEEFDVCQHNPCGSKGVCLGGRGTDPGLQTYSCLCPPHITGVNCSDVIGQENCDRECLNGHCVKVSSTSFKCVCDPGYSGPPCEKSTSGCDSNPCRNGGECEQSSGGFVCLCLEGFQGLDCDTQVDMSCVSPGCLHEEDCTVDENAPECACADGTAGTRCRRQGRPCSPSPCLNNGSCVAQGEDYACRCPRGFSGKTCEDVIDFCSLLSITCLHRGVCLSVAGGYNCLCAPGWSGEFCQYAEDACLIYPDQCRNGATCITTSQPISSPQYSCICPSGYTGSRCETDINECDSNPCRHNGTCTDMVGLYRCSCPPGFQGTSCEVDVDACRLPSTTCPAHTQCLDLPGGTQYMCRRPCPPNIQPCTNGGRCLLNNASSYTCVCAPGWSGRNCRVNVNDCVRHWCQNGATCVDETDGYSCVCPRGFSGAYCEEDIDYCVGHRCSEHGVCLDHRHNYTCRCQVGFEGSLCDLETDECRSSPCANGASCLDGLRDYRCICPPGFEGRTCSENINDCWSRPCLNGGTCVDLTNDFACHCHFGFGGRLCEVNLGECRSGPCQNGALCVEGADPYQCFCPGGFEGVNCEISSDQCDLGFCANNSTCISLAADYECICPAGFSDKNCSTPVIECAPGHNTCRNGGTCYNFMGQVHCTCPPGFTGDDCSAVGKECVLNPCDPEGTVFCEELANAPKCVCQHGYMGQLCETPISHCVEGLCRHGSKCMDLARGFTCHCLPGLTGQYCEVNIDDCEMKPCGALSICEDSLNSYNCFCAPGFIGNNCEIEVNECLSQPCQHGGICSDELNSFSCDCPDGFTGDLCEIDVDECQSAPCLHNSTCVDLANSFQCVCLPGFTGTCCEVDRDECASSPCTNGATCIDQPGNYACQCVAPFTGRNCEFLPCEASSPCENDGECVEEDDRSRSPLGFRCRCRRGYAGSRCEVNVDECSSDPCLHGFCYDVVDGFYCLCNPGYAGVNCAQNMDACASNVCTNNSTCLDLHMSYQCLCLPGWEGDFCQREIDECSSQPCQNDAICIDHLNGYTCVCPGGWTGVHCGEDVDECASAPCLNGARCRQAAAPGGGFSCSCAPLFSGPLCADPRDPCDPLHNACLRGSTCLTHSDGHAYCRCPAGFEGTRCEIDTDECRSGPCLNQGRCLDGVNSYSCDCKLGFSGRYCEEDINECACSPCQNQGVCQDLVNRFRCHCPPGYFGPLCDLDVNECEVSPCLHKGICINKPGGFQCICLPGHSGTWCEIDIDECVSNPCRNSGNCVDGHSQYQCLCAGGFTGPHCETNIDECMSAPCVHGSCVDGVDSYTCVCELGWTGDRCGTNIDECASSPCQAGGSCVDLVDKYACFCVDGYRGRNCEVDVDVCLETLGDVPLCFNGATCVDGEGSNFTCSCPAGFMGDFCEVDVNECCSDPCQHGAICQDLVNRYLCHCRPGWTGARCEEDVNECLAQPCVRGRCLQNQPGNGYTCFCRPGFVGRNCDHNYDDCLLDPCPEGHVCQDGVNRVTCLPQGEDAPPSPGVTPPPWGYTPTPTPLTLTPTGASPGDNQPPGYVRYSGRSYLEFEGVDFGAVNNLTVRFQTQQAQGTILYLDQGAARNGFFFIKLFVQEGVLQYAFSCDQEDGIRRINTSVRVDDGETHIVYVRQSLAPCEAELTVSGFKRVQSRPSNYWSGLTIQRTNHLFIGGLPHRLQPYQGAEPFHNYTGCIEIIEINKLKGFYTSNAIAGGNVDNCRSGFHSNTTEASTRRPVAVSAPLPATPPGGVDVSVGTWPTPARSLPACHHAPCLNGGTCRGLLLSSGAVSFLCDCPLHFTGRLCEKDTTILVPFFNGSSYLELPPPSSLLHSPGSSDYPAPTARNSSVSSNYPAPSVQSSMVTLHLTVKTWATQGTVLYTQEQNFGNRFLHIFIQDGRPVARLGCSGAHVLSAAADQTVNSNRFTPITIRYRVPVGRDGGSCMVEIAVDKGVMEHQEEFLSHPVSELTFGPVFLGNIPSHRAGHDIIHDIIQGVKGFVGCVLDLRVNSQEVDLVGGAVGGTNVQNCDPPFCRHLPCRNGGTCVSEAEDWFCECPPLYSGRLCQVWACERSPCARGATCLPKSALEAVCLCPYGRQGLLCEEAINITRPRFSGNDEFGSTSFAAYPSVPSLSLFYEFQLKLTFANDVSAWKDNLIVYAGQKGRGADGDDFLVLGVRSGRIVHRFSLGSGVGAVVSERLDRRVDVHTVTFGRSRRTGWLQVDGLRNRTGSSPGPLEALDALGPILVGGYYENTPELLPAGSRFRNGFQGCIFDVRLRSRRDARFTALGRPGGRPEGRPGGRPGGRPEGRPGGRPEGRPAFGRSVGQCGATPCSLVRCQNGGTCVDSGSSVYCQCPFGWKGALCSETVSVCDAEHSPPPLCAHGSTCVPLPSGYTCHCPLGATGRYCQQAVAISDPYFSASQSSWMSFPPIRIRLRTELQLQFQTLSPEGILFYTAQHLSARAGDFLCLSLASGFLQLRYDLGDGPRVLESAQRADTSGGTWHSVRAGRDGRRGFLVLDGVEARRNAAVAADNDEGRRMTTLDVATEMFVGGVSTLSAVAMEAVEGEAAGFTGGIREVVVNGAELQLTEAGAGGGANVGDWDGTACGYKVCRNGGRCRPIGSDSFLCSCPPPWTGPVCDRTVDCVTHLCRPGSVCAPGGVASSSSYSCVCPLGRRGRYCGEEEEAQVTSSLKFVGNSSYLKHTDAQFAVRDLRRTRLSFKFSAAAGAGDGLIVWMGRAEDDEDDYLAVGLRAGRLAYAVNLGERLAALPSFALGGNASALRRDDGGWHRVSVSLVGTVTQVFLDGDRVLHEDLDPFERYVALNYGGVVYFGGFELHRNISTVTAGLFSNRFVGMVKDVRLYQDSESLQFLQNSEGFNVYNGDE